VIYIVIEFDNDTIFDIMECWICLCWNFLYAGILDC